MASPPVIVNHSVVRAGASARASAAGLAAYAGTRRGVVIEISEADGRRLGVDGLAAYAANRTGSTGGLWGADGPVPVAEARRAIAQNGGAVLTTVVTVPNDIAPGAGLDRLDAWQALVRSEWPRLFSEMTGVPESRVEFYAAMHINGTSHHVHILTIDREGDWDSLLPKGKMEAARLRDLLEGHGTAAAGQRTSSATSRGRRPWKQLRESTAESSTSACRRTEGSRPPTSGVSTRRPPPR